MEARLPGRLFSSSAGCSPLFIVGLSRSGSTLLAKMLDAHTELAMLPETWCYVTLDELGCGDEFTEPWQYVLFLNGLWKQVALREEFAGGVVANLAADRPLYLGPTKPIMESLGSAYAQARGARIWGEKTPAHILFLPEMRKMFPDARVVVTLRDPRDLLVSYDEAWGGNNRDSLFLMKCAAVVRHYLTQLLETPGFPREQMLVVKYEELVTDPQTALGEVCAFLGIDFDPGMLDFHEQFSRREVPYTPYHKMLSQPVSADRIGRYRDELRAHQISMIEGFLHTETGPFGYLLDAADIALNRKDLTARETGFNLYQQMQSGSMRRRARRKGKVRIAAYKWARALMMMRGRHPAVTADDWRARIYSPLREEVLTPIRVRNEPPPKNIMLNLAAKMMSMAGSWNFAKLWRN
jgi:hypothetical protein